MGNQNTIEIKRRPDEIYTGRVSGKVAVFGAVAIAAIIAAALVLAMPIQIAQMLTLN